MPDQPGNRVTLNDALIGATAQLKQHSPTPALDAQVLLAHSMQQDRTYLIAHAKDVLDGDQLGRFEKLVALRKTGEPVAYITGTQEFWSLPLTVTKDTLIPRPETELLVELALEKIPAGQKCSIADIGTGSGAIALAIASERNKSRVLATDLSPAALDVARGNARALDVSNVEFTEGKDVQPLAGLSFDLIVSNPPYIPTGDPHLDEGDVRFEPSSALVAGIDGLDVIRVLIKESLAHLKKDGWLMIEHGYDQELAINELFNQAGYGNTECYRDLAGQPRVSIGQKVGDN